MKGLEIAKGYYEEFGKPMLEKDFGEYMKFLAVGLTGMGSECFGFDDEVSRDHDFEPCFCIFLPGEEMIDQDTAFRLSRAYDKLPRDYMGLKRGLMRPVGGERHGVMRVSEYYLNNCGCADGNLSFQQWLETPEYALAQAVNGEVFYDGPGLFSKIRKNLEKYPDEIRLKKLAGYLLLMAQSGQYNYRRCIKRRDSAAAQMSVHEFVQASLHCIFLLNRTYMPYYKWCFRALEKLPRLGSLYDSLEYMISSGNDGREAKTKSAMIEDISALIVKELRQEGLMLQDGNDLERQAYRINDLITDGNIRNLNILYGV